MDPSKDDPVAVAKWLKEQYDQKTVSMLRDLRRVHWFLPSGEAITELKVNSRLYRRFANHVAERQDDLCPDLAAGDGCLMFRKTIKIIDGGGLSK
jgi:hypothetical protein